MLILQHQNQVSEDSDVLIAIEKLPHGQGFPLPEYATNLSAGLDLFAAITHSITLQQGERGLVPSGIAIALPQGYEGQIRTRSGLAYNHGVVILNSPGTIDADYRGELKGILINHGKEPFTITPGMRFAQLVIAQVSHVRWQPVDHLEKETHRGIGGFGSTGLGG